MMKNRSINQINNYSFFFLDKTSSAAILNIFTLN